MIVVQSNLPSWMQEDTNTPARREQLRQAISESSEYDQFIDRALMLYGLKDPETGSQYRDNYFAMRFIVDAFLHAQQFLYNNLVLVDRNHFTDIDSPYPVLGGITYPPDQLYSDEVFFITPPFQRLVSDVLNRRFNPSAGVHFLHSDMPMFWDVRAIAAAQPIISLPASPFEAVVVRAPQHDLMKAFEIPQSLS